MTLEEMELFKSKFIFDLNRVKWKALGLLEKQKHSLLLVDDERSFRELMFDVFERHWNYKVFMAENGLKGFRIYENEKIDIIVTDIMMDTLTGIELADRVRKINPNQRIVFFSGWIDGKRLSEKFEEEFEKGIFLFIEKPIDLDTLQNHIYLLLNPHLSNLKINLLDDKSISEVLRKLSPPQLREVHTGIENMTLELTNLYLDVPFQRDNLEKLYTPLPEYMTNADCHYDEQYCKGNLCIATSPECTVKKLTARINDMASVLKQIVGNQLK